ncbi:MAG: hypothetical protein ACYDCC_07005 [Actinomycetota bacterium]
MAPEQDQAAALARALEGGMAATPEIDSLVSLARMLGTLPEPTIDAGFAARLEARLSREAAATLEAPPVAAGVGVVVQLQTRQRRLRRTLAVAIAAAMLLAIPIAASANAAPGSPLYGVRLKVEGLRLWARCTGGAVECGFAHLDRASARVADLRDVIAQGDVALMTVTSHRIRGDLSSGTNKILSASPPVATLIGLQHRLQVTTQAIGDLINQVPFAARGELALVFESGSGLANKVELAIEAFNPAPTPILALPSVTPLPGNRKAPSPKHQTPQSSEAPQQSGASVRTHRSGASDHTGPGGTPNLSNNAPPGETWTTNNTSDPCPLGALAAPGVSTVCGQVGGKA